MFGNLLPSSDPVFKILLAISDTRLVVLYETSLTRSQMSAHMEDRVTLRPRPTPARIAPREKVPRAPITDDDVCPICYNGMTGGKAEEIAWCSYGCRDNFHCDYVQAWIDSKATNGEHGSCPICRIVLDRPDTSRVATRVIDSPHGSIEMPTVVQTIESIRSLGQMIERHVEEVVAAVVEEVPRRSVGSNWSM
jgi:hypothetical protein